MSSVDPSSQVGRWGSGHPSIVPYAASAAADGVVVLVVGGAVTAVVGSAARTATRSASSIVILWLLGLVTSYAMGGLIHVLLVIALVAAWTLRHPEVYTSQLTPAEINAYVGTDFEHYYSEFPHHEFATEVWVNNAWVAAQCIALGVLGLPAGWLNVVCGPAGEIGDGVGRGPAHGGGILVTLIALYSVGYMHEEGMARRRYYAELTLFITGMLGLVVASDYLMLFVFWEIMGLCSYLLIGYWYHKPSAASAAKKAFLTTRVGDAFFLVGLGILFVSFKTLDFNALFEAASKGAPGVDRLELQGIGEPLVGTIPHEVPPRHHDRRVSPTRPFPTLRPAPLDCGAPAAGRPRAASWDECAAFTRTLYERLGARSAPHA